MTKYIIGFLLAFLFIGAPHSASAAGGPCTGSSVISNDLCWIATGKTCMNHGCCYMSVPLRLPTVDGDGVNIIKCTQTSTYYGKWTFVAKIAGTSTTPTTSTTTPTTVTTTNGNPCSPSDEVCSGKDCPQASLGTTLMDHDMKNIIACLVSNDNTGYKWKKMSIEGDDAVPTGSLCGMVENGDADFVKCKGVSFLHNACPDGYTKRIVYNSNDDQQFSCVKD